MKKPPKPASLTALKKARAAVWPNHVGHLYPSRVDELKHIRATLDREVKYREWVKKCQDEGHWQLFS